jgi:hypothetical protein
MAMQSEAVAEVLRPQPRTLDRVHGEYAHLSPEQKRQTAFDKLQAYIDRGQKSAAAALNRVMGEEIDDRLVRERAVDFVAGDGPGIRWDAGPAGEFAVHPHALGQFAQRAGFPVKYLRELQGTPWGRDLVAKNLNALYAHAGGENGEGKLLVRAVGRQVRGVLSNSYRPEDGRPAIDALLGVAKDCGAVVAGGDALDTRTSIKIMVAKPVELFPGEWAVFGLDYRTSDYGNGARELMAWCLRLLCLNGAVTTANYRKVHIGARVVDEVEYSKKTRQLNSAASASAARDIGRALLGPESIAQTVDRVRAAHAAHLDPDAALAALKKDVNVAEAKSIVEKFNSPDVELLPPGQNKWRWSNAISWLATQTEDADRRLDLEQLAGAVLV